MLGQTTQILLLGPVLHFEPIFRRWVRMVRPCSSHEDSIAWFMAARSQDVGRDQSIEKTYIDH